MKRYIFLLATVSTFFGYAQNCHVLSDESTERIMKDVFFLADDKLEGRLPGTEGAELAKNFIADNFRDIGLQPVFEESYFQNFQISDWVIVNQAATMLEINGKNIEKQDFYPVSYSSNMEANAKTVYVGFGISAPDLGHDDYKGKSEKKLAGMIFIMDVSSPDGIHPHSKFVKYHNLGDRIKLAKSKGATGVILVNGGTMASDQPLKFRNIDATGLPVVFLKNSPTGTKYKKLKTVTMSVQMTEQSVEASNVAGFIDNGGKFTVVIGAHYDHLGYGGDNSLYKGEPAIHNGADDNASGTAGLLELARYFASDTTKTMNNYLFIAFTGEERGLLGSNYYVKNSILPLEMYNYMINMDMIGRLENAEIAVSGVGTSPLWRDALQVGNCDLNPKLSESGVGPSDHTSFYNKQIPVLHFFTGTHNDYHKPSDDSEKLNYRGETQVLNYIITVIQKLEGQKLEFTATKNADSRKAPKFSVTLGIVPDYMYQEGGVRLDGVTEGKPASNAGLKTGDIVTKMGDIKVADMQGYMDALAQYKKGDTTTIEFIRGGKKQSVELTF